MEERGGPSGLSFPPREGQKLGQHLELEGPAGEEPALAAPRPQPGGRHVSSRAQLHLEPSWGARCLEGC